MRIIFCVECAELSMRFHLMKQEILWIRHQLTNKLVGGWHYMSSFSSQIHVFFLVAQDTLSKCVEIFCSVPLHTESLSVQTCCCPKENNTIRPTGPRAIFDWHKNIHIFLGKASLDIRQARRAIYTSVELTSLIHRQISRGYLWERLVVFERKVE